MVAGFASYTSIDAQLARARERDALNQLAAYQRKDRDMESKDLDETRRLLYMVLANARTSKGEIVGTLVNAMCHHAGNLDLDPRDTMDELVAAIEDHAGPALDAVQRYIDALTTRLDEAS